MQFIFPDMVNIRFLILDSLPETKKCTMKTTGGNGGGACCNFPFVYKEITYHDCIKMGPNKSWCGTTIDVSRWGECVPKVPVTQGEISCRILDFGVFGAMTAPHFVVS